MRILMTGRLSDRRFQSGYAILPSLFLGVYVFNPLKNKRGFYFRGQK